MFFQGKNLRVVIIDYPVYLLNNPELSTLLGKALSMKQKGYSATYGENVLPMDKYDFFSTHILLCEEKNNEYEPIIAYKATTYDRCLFYDLDFPGISLMRSDGHPTCLQRLEEILSSIQDTSTISYDSSWAQNLEYRFSNLPVLKNTLKEIMAMLIVKHHEEFNIPHMITCGVVKVKTDLFFDKMGLYKLNENSLFTQKNLNNEPAHIFYSSRFSDEALALAEKHKDLWKNKLLIDGSREFTSINAKRVA